MVICLSFTPQFRNRLKPGFHFIPMNRKYLVDTKTREYLCIALQKGKDWIPNNQASLPGFMGSRTNQLAGESELITGEYSDNSFFEKWIRNGVNYLFRY
jgi:hypothetical protein